MNYCSVWVSGIKGIFSWEHEGDIALGARVVVSFRKKNRVGIITFVMTKKPEFETQKILEVWDEHFLPEKYLEIAKATAEENFTSLEKVLGTMVPEKFLVQRHPEKREMHYQISPDFEKSGLEVRGSKQKLALDMIRDVGRDAINRVPTVTVKNLVRKGILLEIPGKIQNIFSGVRKGKPVFHLTDTQKKAYDLATKSDKPVLLFGVTGSGKTEIYKKLAADMIAKTPDGQVLLLVPEIALTPQLIEEFHSLFGEDLAVWHSKLSEGEKVQEWARATSGEARILIGARSAVMVPLKNPKLIILDEEHEWTFKNEFSPRFWTHDVVEKIAKAYSSRVILGTATPRLETFEKCLEGAWESVRIETRVHDVLMPETEIIDLANESKKGNFSPISEALEQELTDILARKKQAMIFLNKRGFAGSTMCRMCGHTFECPNCSANMKLHTKLDQESKFICHICGHLERFTDKCPECHAENFQFKGWGTQSVEKALQEKFPKVRIFRADADSVSGKKDFEILMNRFHAGEADILLGTQMIAKGLDFENVELVGVILADVGLNLPDVRSEERVFQILTQVSGRAGRRRVRGRILIQTFRPNEKVFEFVRCHDSEGFLRWQRTLREKSKMPPFSAIAKITFSHEKKEVAFEEAKKFFRILRCHPGLDPGPLDSKRIEVGRRYDAHWAPAFFPRTHGKYHFHVFVHAPNKHLLIEFLRGISIPEEARVDIDPASLL